MRKRKAIISVMVCFMLLCNLVGIKAAPTDKDDFTISGPEDFKGCYYEVNPDGSQSWTKEACFKDPILAKLVYEQFKAWVEDDPGSINHQDPDDPMTFRNTNMREILAEFRGDIKAKGKKIKSLKGVQFLIHAGTIDLSKNEIEDLTELNDSVLNAGNYSKFYYGYGVGQDPDNPDEARNVTFILGGNPFKKLPYQLGGRLVVEATQTLSSTYLDQVEEVFVFKRDDVESFTGELNIQKCKIMDQDASGNPIPDGNGGYVYRNVNIISGNFINSTTGEGEAEILSEGIKLDTDKGDTGSGGNKLGFTDEKLYFKDLLTSRHQRVAIGIDQEIHYWTSDEMDTTGPGSQSFKYYVDPYLYVYDMIKVTSTATGNVELTKTDKDSGKKLQGAEYSLFKGTTELQKGLTTDANGVLKISGLAAGDYSLKETKAPEGYELSTTPVTFKIETADVTISGGTSTFTTTGNDPQTYTVANNHETFMAGTLDGDIELKQVGAGEINSVKVTYRKVDDKVGNVNNIKENYEKTFTSLADAQADINTYKKAGHLFGGVKVDVTFKDNDVVKASVAHTNTLIPITPPVDPTPPVVPPVTPPLTPPVTPNKPNTPPASPNTGDDSNVGLWSMLAIVSFGCIG